MLATREFKKEQKISEDAFFIVDFKESIFIPNPQSGPVIHYGWTPVPEYCEEQKDSLKRIP